MNENFKNGITNTATGAKELPLAKRELINTVSNFITFSVNRTTDMN